MEDYSTVVVPDICLWPWPRLFTLIIWHAAPGALNGLHLNPFIISSHLVFVEASAVLWLLLLLSPPAAAPPAGGVFLMQVNVRGKPVVLTSGRTKVTSIWNRKRWWCACVACQLTLCHNQCASSPPTDALSFLPHPSVVLLFIRGSSPLHCSLQTLCTQRQSRYRLTDISALQSVGEWIMLTVRCRPPQEKHTCNC